LLRANQFLPEPATARGKPASHHQGFPTRKLWFRFERCWPGINGQPINRPGPDKRNRKQPENPAAFKPPSAAPMIRALREIRGLLLSSPSLRSMRALKKHLMEAVVLQTLASRWQSSRQPGGLPDSSRRSEPCVDLRSSCQYARHPGGRARSAQPCGKRPPGFLPKSAPAGRPRSALRG